MVDVGVRSRWLVPVLVVVASLAVGGGLLARDFYHGRQQAEGDVAAPSTHSLPLDEQPGSPLVRLTADASAHPHDETVRGLLQAYFDGINGRNYERWKTAVTSERVRNKPQEEWLTDYRSTRDGSIVVHRIETAQDDTMRVLLSFTSTQDVADAPLELPERCIHWRLVLPIAMERGHWRIDTVPAGTAPEMEAC